MRTANPDRRPSPLRVGSTFAWALVAGAVTTAWSVLTRALTFIENWLVEAKHAQYGLSVTRILIAATGIGLLLANFSTRLYTFGAGSAWNGEAARPISDFPRIWLFSAFHRLALDNTAFTAAYLGLLALAGLLLLGWRTRLVLPLFFVGWVSFVEMNDSVGDQGDNMYRIVLLSMLFADCSARWSLDARRRSSITPRGGWLRRTWQGERLLPSWTSNVAHNLVLVSMTCHVCFVYASGALYKAGGSPWQAGYAIYNPLHTDRFGPWPELSDLVGVWAPLVTALSWSSIILQMSFPMMLLNRVTRVIALFGILGFHVGIAVMMGLPWFSLAMIAIDSIFIRDVTWRRVADFTRQSWTIARAPRDQGVGPAPPATPVDPPSLAPPLPDGAPAKEYVTARVTVEPA